MEEAGANAAEILKIKPDYTVEFYRKTTPYKDKAYLNFVYAIIPLILIGWIISILSQLI